MLCKQGPHALFNEQLVYVAAFAVGATLVFGDRPKQITYARMLWLPSIGEVWSVVVARALRVGAKDAPQSAHCTPLATAPLFSHHSPQWTWIRHTER